MSTQLDLDDVAATSPLAARQLADLRAEVGSLRADAEPCSFVIIAHGKEFGDVLLPRYAGSMQVIHERVMEAARREGFSGSFEQRLSKLCWRVEPLFRRANAARKGEGSEG